MRTIPRQASIVSTNMAKHTKSKNMRSLPKRSVAACPPRDVGSTTELRHIEPPCWSHHRHMFEARKLGRSPEVESLIYLPYPPGNPRLTARINGLSAFYLPDADCLK